MQEKLRCRTCGTDYPYTDHKQIECEVCECALNTVDMKLIIPPKVTQQADPLEGY